MPSRALRVLCTLVVMLGLVVATGGRARAQTAATTVEVLELHGTNDGSGIDPKLGKLPQLGKPPFSSYNSYRLLARGTLELTRGSTATRKLVTTATLQVTLKDVLEPTQAGEVRRYVLAASVKKANGTSALPLLEVSTRSGEWVFVAGQAYKGGTLMVGLRIKP